MLGFEMGAYTAESVETFLIEWFVSHVTHEDVKIELERFIRAYGYMSRPAPRTEPLTPRQGYRHDADRLLVN